MKSHLECIPCFVRQTLEAIQRVTEDTKIQESILRFVLNEIRKMNLSTPPPAMGQRIHRWIRERTGIEDPYLETKRESTQLCLGLLPGLEERTRQSVDPLETAVRLAIAGNVIDLGANSQFDNNRIEQSIQESIDQPMLWNRDDVVNAIFEANRILYLADNAGELVFDRLLIELCSLDKVTVVVRGNPVLNDATLDTAEASGLKGWVKLMSNGSDAPGTILEDCSDQFLQHFYQADLIIAKGQGNYESLSESNRNIIFLLKAKCPVIARHIGCEVGDIVIKQNRLDLQPVHHQLLEN